MNPLPPDFVPRSKEFNIVAIAEGNKHRIAKIIFGPDGSIYVAFPGFTKSQGLVGEIRLASALSYPVNLSLADYGKVTGCLVKYSHHADGWAHFSQKAKVKTEIRKQSRLLDELEGHLFTIQIQGLNNFKPPGAVDRTPPITFNIEGNIRAIKFICFRNKLANLRTDTIGPRQGKPLILKNKEGALFPGIAIAPENGTPFDQYMLFISAIEIPWLSQDHEPCLMFLGGFDGHKISLDHSKDTSFLALLYPCSDPDRLRKAIGTIDLP